MKPSKEHSELVNKMISGARFATALRLAGQLFSWLGTIIVVRFITPADYGLNSMLQSPLEAMMFLSLLGLDVALIQSPKLNESEIRSAFGWLLLVNGALFLLYFFGGSMLALYFKEPNLEILAKALAFIFLLVPFRVIPNALLDRDLKFKLRAQVDLGTTIATVAFTLILAIYGAGVWALVLGVLFNSVTKVIVLMILEPWIVKPSLKFNTIKHLLSFGGISTATGLIAMINGVILTMIIGRMLGSELLGIYAVALQFALLPLAKIMPAINQTLVPAFAKFQEQRDSATHYLMKTIGIASIILVPAMLGMASIADVFVQTILGDKWLGAAMPIAILSIMAVFKIISSLMGAMMSSLGFPQISLKTNLIISIFMVPAILLGMQQGTIGLSFAILAIEFLGMIIFIKLSQKYFNISFGSIYHSMAPAILCSTAMAGLVIIARKAAHLTGFPDMLLAIGVGTLSYYLLLRFLFYEKLSTALTLLAGQRISRIFLNN